MDPIVDFFNFVYSEHERYWWREPTRYSSDPDDHLASLITQQTLRYFRDHRPPGRMLDIGAGEGADSIRMAKLGWQVSAIDSSAVAVDKIRALAAREGVDVRAQTGDLASLELEEVFDLIICNGVLHYVEDKTAACATLQRLTVPGGTNVISLWSTFTPVPACHQVVPTFPDDEYGVVYSAYQDWDKSLYYLERSKLEASHSDMPGHHHSFIKMIAHKG